MKDKNTKTSRKDIVDLYRKLDHIYSLQSQISFYLFVRMACRISLQLKKMIKPRDIKG